MPVQAPFAREQLEEGQFSVTCDNRVASSGQHMGILFAHAQDEWNILSSTPLLVFERAPVGFQTGDLRCDKDLVKRDERL